MLWHAEYISRGLHLSVFNKRLLLILCLAFLLSGITWHTWIISSESASRVLVSFHRLSVMNLCGSSFNVCSIDPPNRKGRIAVQENVSLVDAELKVRGVKSGGKWWPTHCQARWRVALVVPFRGRYHQLGQFLNHMHNFLQHQELNYTIYITEQEGTEIFNKGRVMNAGYLEVQKEGPWDCIAFHDIDMLPEDDRNLYHCSQDQPRHLVITPSHFNYTLPYERFFGGASLWTEAQVKKVNGWSNKFWGWGAEDDEMYYRVIDSGMNFYRYPAEIGRYLMSTHALSERNEKREDILKANRGQSLNDGLSTLKYVVKSITRQPLFTHILAYIGSKSEQNETTTTLGSS